MKYLWRGRENSFSLYWLCDNLIYKEISSIMPFIIFCIICHALYHALCHALYHALCHVMHYVMNNVMHQTCEALQFAPWVCTLQCILIWWDKFHTCSKQSIVSPPMCQKSWKCIWDRYTAVPFPCGRNFIALYSMFKMNSIFLCLLIHLV